MIEVISSFPNIMKYWDAEKNLKWDSNSIGINSRNKVFWSCPDCSHHWQALVSTVYRLSKIHDKFCPCCDLGRELVPEKNSILAVFPSIINYIDFHIEDKETIKEKLMSYTFTSKQVFHFKCPTCHEAWRGSAQDSRFSVTNENKLSHKGCNKSPKSYYIWTYPNLFRIYRNDVNVQPFETLRLDQNVTLPYQWKCDKCHFEFETSLDRLFSKIRRNGAYCPECQASFNQPIDLVPNRGPIHFDLSEQLKQLYIDFGSWSTENTIYMVSVDLLSDIEVNWVCSKCKGVYSCPVYEKDRNNCPYCHHKKLLKGFNTLEKTHPHLKIFWNPKNSGDLGDYWDKSHDLVSWTCPCCHVSFDCSPQEMVLRTELDNRNFQTCPNFCDWSTGLFKNNPVYDNPILNKEWSSKNLTSIHLAQIDIETKKYWWSCSKCGGDYLASIPIRREVSNTCPYCNNEEVLEGYNSLLAVYPDLAKKWSPKNTVSSDSIIPIETEKRNYIWHCDTCELNFTERFNIVLEKYLNDGSFSKKICPYCSKRLPDSRTESLDVVKPFLVEEWLSDKYGEISEEFPGSKKLVEWECRRCHGHYKAKICDRGENDKCCPYCTGKKLLSGYNSFDILYPNLIKEWDYLNNILLANPDEVKPSSQQNVWWICKNNPEHRYKMPIKKRILFEKRSKESCLICKGRRRKRQHFVPYKKLN